jgi:hypothetical protein
VELAQMIVALLMSAALVQEAPAQTSTPAPAPAAANAPGELKPGERKVRVVCRTETTTGTRFGKRTCISVDDFKRREEESRAGFAEMQRTLNTTYSRGN